MCLHKIRTLLTYCPGYLGKVMLVPNLGNPSFYTQLFSDKGPLSDLVGFLVFVLINHPLCYDKWTQRKQGIVGPSQFFQIV